MTLTMRLRTGLLAAILGLGALAASGRPALAQTPEKYLELLRSDVRATKVEILTDALELSNKDADAFWPIYRAYDAELATIGDRRVALIKKFAATYGTTTEDAAAAFAREWFGIQDDRAALRRKYFGKVAKATSSIIAARFIQVENLVGMLIDIQIAAELPLVQ
jgi:hypothetical protein